MDLSLRNQNKIIESYNQIMINLISELENLPVLGPEFKSTDFEPIWLTTYRIKKSFFIPDPAHNERLHIEAVQKVLEGDTKLTGFCYKNPKLRFVKRALYQGRLKLEEILKDFRLDFSRFEVSPGETFVSKGGYTSLYQKLKDQSQWTVTADAVPYVVRMIYFNRGLKKAAMHHIRRNTTLQYRKRLYQTLVTSRKTIGLDCFAVLCEKHLFTIVYGSRIETVPKNNESRRTINVEPWLNVMLQRAISQSLRDCLKAVGNDLEYGQQDHQQMISNPKYATIDFANASNSTAVNSVLFMFPSRVQKLLMAARSPYVYDKISDSYYPLNMLSAMGNGFTFEVMTLLLLSIGRTLDDTCRVYGDDVIIKNRHANHFIDCCDVLGYRVNAKKTFINSSFRESCGAYFHDKYGYLISFDFDGKDNMSIVDVIIACNKLYLLRNQHKAIYRAYSKVSRLFPPRMKGPAPSHGFEKKDFLSSWVWVDGCKSIRNRETLALRTKVRSKLNDFHYEGEFHLVESVKFCPDVASKTFVRNVGFFKTLHYIYSGRRVNDVIRNRGTFQKVFWVVHPNFISPVSQLFGN